MTPSYLPSLEPATVKREKVRKRVRPTSIAQYAVARETLTQKREAEALRLIAAHWNRWQESPTIGEIAKRMLSEQHINLWMRGAESWQFMGARLWLARGVSGLQKRGLVEAVPNGKRRCPLTQVEVETWRVTPAGRSKVSGAAAKREQES